MRPRATPVNVVGVIQVQPRPSEVRCPLCFAAFVGGDARTCARCGTCTHRACAAELTADDCPTAGCVVPAAPPRVEIAPPRVVVAPRHVEIQRQTIRPPGGRTAARAPVRWGVGFVAEVALVSIVVLGGVGALFVTSSKNAVRTDEQRARDAEAWRRQSADLTARINGG